MQHPNTFSDASVNKCKSSCCSGWPPIQRVIRTVSWFLNSSHHLSHEILKSSLSGTLQFDFSFPDPCNKMFPVGITGASNPNGSYIHATNFGKARHVHTLGHVLPSANANSRLPSTSFHCIPRTLPAMASPHLRKLARHFLKSIPAFFSKSVLHSCKNVASITFGKLDTQSST